MNAQPKDGWYNPDATTFGDRVSGAREDCGMTQEELARRIGVKLSTLRKWEEDLSEPRANRLSMMAGLLNVSLLWLWTGQGDGPDGPKSADVSADVADILIHIREIQTQLSVSAERLGQLERQLRGTLQAEAVD